MLRGLVGEGKAAYVHIASSRYSGFEVLNFSSSPTKTRVTDNALLMLFPSHSFLIA
jgi:hypothetical protein